MVKSLREDLKDKSDMMLSLTGIIDKLTKENQDLRSKQAQLQVTCKYRLRFKFNTSGGSFHIN